MSACGSAPVCSIPPPPPQHLQRHAASSQHCRRNPGLVSVPIARSSSREQPPRQNLFSKGQRATAEQRRGIASWNWRLLGHGLKQKENKACLGRKPHIPESGLVPKRAPRGRAACQAQTLAWEAGEVPWTGEISNKTWWADLGLSCCVKL